MCRWLIKFGLLTYVSGIVCSAVWAETAIIPERAQLSPNSGVDLGIADDETFKRPNSWGEVETKTKFAAGGNGIEQLLTDEFSGPASRPGISIAWRNAAQVEEVEVRVRNLGSIAGEGRVWVDILDETGQQILRLEPPDELKQVRIPAFGNGGREGKILRMKSSRELNNIIDQFDRERRRYDVQATVETIGAVDVNPRDNKKVKSWNVPHRVEPSARSVFNYKYRNGTAAPVTVRWLFEHTPYPAGWTMSGVPDQAEPFVLQPGETIKGTLTLDAPSEIAEGAFLESRLALLEQSTGSIWQQHEWFLVYDTVPPTVTDYRMVLTNDHRIAIQALVADKGSGVLEATGVSTQYSTDGGLTWSARAHNYKAGNFVIPTLFEAVLGPFAPGTDLQVRFSAKDTAGNATSLIPDVAAAVRAPAGSEKLLDLAVVYPRTQPNAIFAMDPGTVDVAHIAGQFSAAIANATSEPERVTALSAVLRGLPVTDASKKTLMDAISSLSLDPEKQVVAERFREVVSDLTTAASNTAVVSPLAIQRVEAAGANYLKMTTLGLKVQ